MKKNKETRSSEKEAAFRRGLLERMLLIRRFEEQASKMYGLRKIGGFLHLYIGQEAVAVGAVAAMDLEKDYVLTAYRDHGHALAVGSDPGSLMAELYGKAAGCARGKGGSMHFFDVEKHFFGGNGIVGAHIPLAAGFGLKLKNRGEKGAAFCFFGDGAIHQGSFHETLNMAAIWKLPVVFICENNQYGMGTFYKRVSSVEDFSVMGGSYGIPGRQVEGMDADRVRESVAEARDRAVSEGRPSLLEIKTYRYRGHSMSDPARYRTREELDNYKGRDPLVIYKKRLVDEGLLSEEQYGEMDAKARDVVSDAIHFAESSPEPAVETLFEDLYV
jgi:pyruvate dehydrogenase E1 component alpha subunit